MKNFKMDSIRDYLALLEAESANPYAANPEQAAIYAAMSPEDKAWATKGGGRPDLTDPAIAYRAPNNFKPVAVATPVAPPTPAPAQAQAPATQPEPAQGQAAKPAPKTWNKGVLGRGMKGPEVSALQKKLGIPETGVYDAATVAAVQKLQKTLGVDADGAYGPITRAAHEKSGQAAKPATNVAAPGQPGYTAPQPELGTRKGATQAIPTTPVNPANPGGVSSKMDITPDQAQAVLDNGSERDIQAFGGRERLQQLAGIANTPPSAATQATSTDSTGNATDPESQVFVNPAAPATAPVKESSGYDEVQRIVSLVHYR